MALHRRGACYDIVVEARGRKKKYNGKNFKCVYKIKDENREQKNDVVNKDEKALEVNSQEIKLQSFQFAQQIVSSVKNEDFLSSEIFLLTLCNKILLFCHNHRETKRKTFFFLSVSSINNLSLKLLLPAGYNQALV